MGQEHTNNTADLQDTIRRARLARGSRASMVFYHRDMVKVVPLAEGTALTVGRTWPSDVVIEDSSLSRQHARFTRVQGGVEVEDLNSTNGTHQDGQRIERVVLRPGQTLSLGSVTASFNLTAEQAGLLGGVESYERFLSVLEDEVLRAREFRRGLCLMMVRSVGGPAECRAQTPRWLAGLTSHLRPVDRVALYGDASALFLFPELEGKGAWEMARRLLSSAQAGDAPMVIGLTWRGASADELVDKARLLCRRATPQSPVCTDDPADTALLDSAPKGYVFAAPKMQVLQELIYRVAPASIPILISGETGSGKEVIAQAVHAASDRGALPMRSVNCGAIASNLLESVLFGHEKGAFTGADSQRPGLFEQAHQSTLLLDEIGELSAAAQVALLRVLETGRLTRVGGLDELSVDVRVLAATHRDLASMVEEGSFRQDLLYRLNSMTLEVPPLRERPEDVQALIELFLHQSCEDNHKGQLSFSPEAQRLLLAHTWPGNVRELRNVIDRAVVISQGAEIRTADLPTTLQLSSSTPTLMPPPPGTGPVSGEGEAEIAGFKESVRAYEVQLLLGALRQTGGNQTQAAKLLQMPLRTLVHKLKTHGIRKTFESE